MEPAQLAKETLESFSLATDSGLQTLEWEGAALAFDFEPAASGCNKELLLLINGYQRSRADFRAFRRRIKDRLPNLATLALDNRGTGDTRSNDVTLSIERMARDALFLAESYAVRLQLPGYAVLGVSMGGMIAQSLAAHNPHVSHVILVSTSAGGNERVFALGSLGENQRTYEAWPKLEAAMRARMEQYFGTRFVQKSPLLIKTMAKNMLEAASQNEFERWARLQHEAVMGFAGGDQLSDIHAPALIITGDEDRVIPPANSEFLARKIVLSQLIRYPSVGHLILIEEPELFVHDVASFLREP